VLASGHFYTSPALLGGVGVVVAIATLLVIVAQYVTGTARRVLTYSLVSDTALLSEAAREKAGPDLRVTRGGNALDDPHVVSIRIEYKGRRDLRSTDFEGAKPLTIKVGTDILQRLDQGIDADTMPGISASLGKQAVTIGPGLIKNGQVIGLDLLTDGPVSLECRSPLADVTIREAQVDDESGYVWVTRLQAAAFTLFGIGLFGWLVAEQAPFYFVLVVFLLGGLGFAIWIARAVASSRRHRGRRTAADTQERASDSASPEVGAPFA
jgi:hypothetical protein